MSVSKRSTEPGHFHAVRFYKDADSLCAIVGTFLREGFAASQPALVIATPVHGTMIEECLEREGHDVATLKASGQLVFLDAETVLAQFMVDGMPSSALFKDALIPALDKICEGRKDCVVRAYGEMVDVLWKAGQTVAAIRLEMLWNDLARTRSFSLLCGYAMGNFYKDAAVDEISAQHSHVLTEPLPATHEVRPQ
jgi:hypothetical protein